MVLVLTQCRWRSRPFPLIVIRRRAAAYILARDMVVVSRWIINEMKTSDAPSRRQEQKQQQEQDAPPISEQAKSEACLARACVTSAPNETYQSTRSMSRHSSEQAALPYPANDSRYTDLTGYRQALLEVDLDGRPTTLATEERLKRSHARLSVWEKDMRRNRHRSHPAMPQRRTKQKLYFAARGLCQTKPRVVDSCLPHACYPRRQPK